MKILFGVFDWGLGHATRDIPLIEELLKNKHQVDIISTGRALELLKYHFKNKCVYFDVPSLYYVYGYRRLFKLNFALSTIKLLNSLNRARKQSEKIIKQGYDRVISDCRFDVYDRVDNSFLINHQLRFKSPIGTEWLLESWLNSQMKKYKYVLVPDFDKKDLSGKLSHNLRYLDKNRIRYIGILSRLRKLNLKKDIDYFISLSGPDKTRVTLEKKILSQVNKIKGKIVIAGGDSTEKSKKISNNIEFYGFLNLEQQENMMNRAKFLIIRSGYSTMLEMAELDIKKAILIPSPGQTEQEYLAGYCETNRYFHRVNQNKLDLAKDIIEAKKFNGYKPLWKTKVSVRKFMEAIGLC